MLPLSTTSLLQYILAYLYFYNHLQKGLIMGKPMGGHPITYYINPNEPHVGSTMRSRDLSSAWALHLRPTFGSPKRWSKLTNVSSKLGRGPTGPQHSPMTCLESLRSGKHCFKGFKIISSYLNLLLLLILLLNELLDHLCCNKPLQSFFHCQNCLVQL
jgi:hypothetical protein